MITFGGSVVLFFCAWLVLVPFTWLVFDGLEVRKICGLYGSEIRRATFYGLVIMSPITLPLMFLTLIACVVWMMPRVVRRIAKHVMTEADGEEKP